MFLSAFNETTDLKLIRKKAALVILHYVRKHMFKICAYDWKLGEIDHKHHDTIITGFTGYTVDKATYFYIYFNVVFWNKWLLLSDMACFSTWTILSYLYQVHIVILHNKWFICGWIYDQWSLIMVTTYLLTIITFYFRKPSHFEFTIEQQGNKWTIKPVRTIRPMHNYCVKIKFSIAEWYGGGMKRVPPL